MRQITKEAKKAIDNFSTLWKSNTAVVLVNDSANLYLHGNMIASIKRTGETAFSMCGWGSVTTRERLKAAGVMIAQRKGQQYYINPLTREEILIDVNGVYILDANKNLITAPII